MPTPIHRGSRALLENLATPIALYLVIVGFFALLGDTGDLVLRAWQIHIWSVALVAGGALVIGGTAARRVRLEAIGHIALLWGILVLLLLSLESGSGIAGTAAIGLVSTLRLRSLSRVRKAERELGAQQQRDRGAECA